MQTYPLDIDPEQLVRWLIAERKANPIGLKTVARQMTEVRSIPLRKELRLGDEEREDLSEVATVATLEIAPAHANDGWLLTVVVEDEVGPPDADIVVAEGEQQIDIGTFYDRFIRRERGIAIVVAEVQDLAAQARVERLLAAIEQDRHEC
jgi:hypothetical protein